jgi:hypothetical protein
MENLPLPQRGFLEKCNKSIYPVASFVNIHQMIYHYGWWIVAERKFWEGEEHTRDRDRDDMTDGDGTVSGPAGKSKLLAGDQISTGEICMTGKQRGAAHARARAHLPGCSSTRRS